MRAIFQVRQPLVAALAACLLGPSIAPTAPKLTRRQVPVPTDVDPRLTEVTRRLERTFADAIIRKDSVRLEQILAPEFTLRIGDIPQGSAPRAFWLDGALHKLKAGSVQFQHMAARRLGDSVAVVAFIHRQTGSAAGRDVSGVFYIVDLWKHHRSGWQLVARYSSPVGQHVARGSREPPPPTDIDPPLTDTLARLERQLGETALHGFRDTMEVERLVGAEFAIRFADAPERSVPRARWVQPTSSDTLTSLDERYHAARRLAQDLAVVSLVLTQQASVAGQERGGDVYLVDIWQRRAERWQLIARYSSKPLGPTADRPSPP